MSLPHTRPCPGSSSNCTAELLPRDDTSGAASSNFECSICLELSQDPVVTMCGHLFCWSCLHQWITIHSATQECPVCKACVQDKIIPLYGRGKAGGFTDSARKTGHEFDKPRPPPVQRRYASVPLYTPGFQRHGFVSDGNMISRGGQSTYTAAPFGLFPALFGFHMISLPDHGSRVSSSGSTYNAPLRLPALGHMTSQQQRSNALQESVLYWFLILLACFVVSCLLFF